METRTVDYGEPGDEDFVKGRKVLIALDALEGFQCEADGRATVIFLNHSRFLIDEDFDDLATTLAIEGMVLRTPSAPRWRQGWEGQ